MPNALTRLSPSLIAALLPTCLLTACEQRVARGDAEGDTTLVSVSASGEVKRVPDTAILSTGVVTQAADATTAISLSGLCRRRDDCRRHQVEGCADKRS